MDGHGYSFFVSAGEPSGDLHGSALINALKKLSPSSTFAGLGGDLMRDEGLDSLYHIRKLATVGFTDVIKKYSFFKKVISGCSDYIKQNAPDAVILIDYPGFNIRLAGELRKFYKNKIIYYISPQLWAWHEKRVNKIRKYVDKMLVVFPFEVDFYKKFGVEAGFVGHPLTERIRDFLKENPQQKSALKKTITVLPGSRKDEISHHMPVLTESFRILKKNVDADIVVSKAPSLGSSLFKQFEEPGLFTFTGENVYSLIARADAVLTKAGTSTMECSLIGTPYLIFYKTSPLNYHILKPIVKINNLGIANILSGENIVKEFIQKDFTPANIASEALQILQDESYSNSIRLKLKRLWEILGNENASEKAAKIIIQQLRK